MTRKVVSARPTSQRKERIGRRTLAKDIQEEGGKRLGLNRNFVAPASVRKRLTEKSAKAVEKSSSRKDPQKRNAKSFIRIVIRRKHWALIQPRLKKENTLVVPHFGGVALGCIEADTCRNNYSIYKIFLDRQNNEGLYDIIYY